jgi:3-oxoacyl-[acyl-carrier protein] reductase
MLAKSMPPCSAAEAAMQAQQLFDLTGEIVLVTGASSGLGARFAQVLAANGAKVVLAARRVDRLEALRAEIGDRAHAVAFDATDRATFAKTFDAAENKFGPVTLLINNAGIGPGSFFVDTTAEDWDRVQAVNVDAVWLMAQEAAKRMIAAKVKGSIINIASVLSYRVSLAVSAYAVSKAAVAQMTQAMALELARYDIRVNAIAPGYITTELTDEFLKSPAGQKRIQAIPQRRVGDASDLDGTLLLLSSRKASGFMTGSVVVVDGGHLTSFT